MAAIRCRPGSGREFHAGVSATCNGNFLENLEATKSDFSAGEIAVFGVAKENQTGGVLLKQQKFVKRFIVFLLITGANYCFNFADASVTKRGHCKSVD